MVINDIESDPTLYSDPEQFRQDVEDSEGHPELSTPVKGTPMGADVETLIETAQKFDDPFINTSNRHPPTPVGAAFRLTHLHEVKELLETLGTEAIIEMDDHDDGTLEVLYHFD